MKAQHSAQSVVHSQLHTHNCTHSCTHNCTLTVHNQLYTHSCTLTLDNNSQRPTKNKDQLKMTNMMFTFLSQRHWFLFCFFLLNKELSFSVETKTQHAQCTHARIIPMKLTQVTYSVKLHWLLSMQTIVSETKPFYNIKPTNSIPRPCIGTVPTK